MKLIIPMAGRGTRVRPHSHVTPKPLINIRGKNMVERIVDMFDRVLPAGLDEAVYIIGPDFGADIREQLTALSEIRGIKAHFAVQEETLGTAHAVSCANNHLEGDGIIVYADTLFDMEPGVDLEGADVIAWVKHVDDPRRFGIAVREGDRVVALVEKPQEPISNEALIGIYYVKDLGWLRREITAFMDHGTTGPGGEYFLTDVFDRMLKEGAVFKTASVTQWLDAGTIPALLDTTKVILETEKEDAILGEVENCVIHDPVYIGPEARVSDAIIGPYVSIESGAKINHAIIRESVVFQDAHVENTVLTNSIIGRHATVKNEARRLNVGDHSEIGEFK